MKYPYIIKKRFYWGICLFPYVHFQIWSGALYQLKFTFICFVLEISFPDLYSRYYKKIWWDLPLWVKFKIYFDLPWRIK